MRSLQRRVIFGGLAWAVLATLIGGFALITVFDQIADRRFNETLNERHTQVIIALGDTQSPENVEAVLADPSYARVYSGRYWQEALVLDCLGGPDRYRQYRARCRGRRKSV